MGRQPKIVTVDATTARLQSQHDQVQAEIEALPEGRRQEVRQMQAEVDAEIAKMNSELDEQYEIEARWRAATGLHHSDAEKVLKHMSKQPVGKIVEMYGKQWVHTPFKTIVQVQQYVDVLQERVIGLMTDIQAEAVVHQLVDQRTKILAALEHGRVLMNRAEKDMQEFTNLTWFGLMKLSVKRLFQRGNNG